MEIDLQKAAIRIRDLNFSFGGPRILHDVNLELPYGARCLLVGANGAGKSTLLKLIAGKRLVRADIQVLGKNAFEDAPPGITYLGTEWAGNPIVRRDMPVTRLIKSLGAEQYPDRCAKLLEIMDVDPNWHMHEVSDGERRRVQIVLGLLRPWELLLLDEVTVDLDVLGGLPRSNLLKFLREETEQRPCTIVYATHIFDGLGNFPTHITHLRQGSIVKTCDLSIPNGFPELEAERAKGPHSLQVDNSPLLRVVEKWLEQDDDIAKEKRRAEAGNERLKTRWEVLSDNMKEVEDNIDILRICSLVINITIIGIETILIDEHLLIFLI